MKHVIYISKSRIRPEKSSFRSEILSILSQSQINNISDNITGILCYDRGRFIQYIEGPDARVDSLVDRLICDKRHTAFTIRSEGPVDIRRFPLWSMAMLNAAEIPEPGFPFGELSDASPADLLSFLDNAARDNANLILPDKSRPA